MNKYNVRCSIEEKNGFPFDEFPILSEEGTYTVTLVDKTCPLDYCGQYLICAFETDTNIKFRFNVWRKPVIEYYMPDKSEIDFKKVPLYTKWKCTFTRTRNNNIRWKTAEPINDSNLQEPAQ